MTVAVAPNSTGSHRLVGQMRSAITSTTEIWVSPEGSDTVGNGSILFPYLTITEALTKVTSARKIVRLYPGSYAEAAALVWPTGVSGIQLLGYGNRWQTVISASTGDQVIDVTPGVQTSTFELTIAGVQIDHDTTGQDGLDVDNTGMTKKLNIYLGDVGFTGDSADKSIVTLQGDTSNAIRIYWDGQNGNVEGDVYLDAGNNGNRFYAERVVFDAGMETAADAVAYDIRLLYCGVLHEGITGGNGAQTITAAWCYSNASGTLAALDTHDLAGSHAEVIVGT